ncbi:MAG: lytic transglycosylase domain-containing protein [Caulobacterales bacterium]
MRFDLASAGLTNLMQGPQIGRLKRLFLPAGVVAISMVLGLAALFAAGDSIAYAASILQGTPPTPRPKPPAPPTQSVMNSSIDYKSIDAVRIAFAAADRGDWASARAAQALATDPGAKKLIAWRIVADRGRAPAFAEIDAALTDLQGFPRVTDLRSRAEEQIDFSGLTAAGRVAWLQKNGGPSSNGGRASLARALIDSGQKEEGKSLLRDVWRDQNLTLDQERRILSGYGPYLTPADHVARLNLVLWLHDSASASLLTPYVDPQARQLADVRLKLQARAKNVDASVAALPSQAQVDPGLLYDRAQWRKTARGAPDPCEVLEQIDGAKAPIAARERLWADLRKCVAAAIKDGNQLKAYSIASRHGLSSGAQFADAEFLAGFLALRKLRDPVKAETHFANLEAGVRTPVSKARAIYWRALTAQARGDATAATTYFGLAAQYPTTFYGQLASQKYAPGAALALPPSPAPTDADKALFEARDLTKAVRILAALGERELFEEFALRLDDQLSSAAEHELLSDVSMQQLLPKLAVRSAKSGMQRGIVSTTAAYPLSQVPASASRVLEPAFTLAITRQESEFDPNAVSSAGARGLMQLLPSTARVVAKQTGRQYDVSWLTMDPGYNMELGSEYLAQMVRNWGGSYILAIASYNAGPGRARQWVDAYGDPRSPSVDPIDWLETIPIEETRNYVQRVMENLQVYRARLASNPPPLRLQEDLKRGSWN